MKHQEYCANCQIMFCNTCSSPPGSNSFIMQNEVRIKKALVSESIEQKYRASATLQDLTADVLIHLPDQLDLLASILPEGHPPWHILIKAWQRSRKIKSRPTLQPREKLFKLLSHPASNIP